MRWLIMSHIIWIYTVCICVSLSLQARMKGFEWAGVQQMVQVGVHTKIRLRSACPSTVWLVFDGLSMGTQRSNISSGGKLRLIILYRCADRSESSLYTHANLHLILDTGFYQLITLALLSSSSDVKTGATVTFTFTSGSSSASSAFFGDGVVASLPDNQKSRSFT